MMFVRIDKVLNGENQPHGIVFLPVHAIYHLDERPADKDDEGYTIVYWELPFKAPNGTGSVEWASETFTLMAAEDIVKRIEDALHKAASLQAHIARGPL